MAIIEVKNLSKTFKVKLKEKGLKGSIKSIFKPKYKTYDLWVSNQILFVNLKNSILVSRPLKT